MMGIKGALYSTGEKKSGRGNEDARDCIDIAVKIVLELRAQIESDKNKKITKKLFMRLYDILTLGCMVRYFKK